MTKTIEISEEAFELISLIKKLKQIRMEIEENEKLSNLGDILTELDEVIVNIGVSLTDMLIEEI